MGVTNTFSNGTVADADEMNANFTWTGMVPVGAVISFLKTYTNTPTLDDRFVECNGQTLSDAESVYDGQVIPDLNGDAQFLYGAATSGGTKTEDFLPNHRHNYLRSNNTNTSITTSSSTEDTTVGIIQYETAGTAWE